MSAAPTADEPGATGNVARVYRFALRPKWILSHLFVLGLVVLMMNLGFWQLRRLDERKAFNRTVRASVEAVPAPLTQRETPGEWQRVIVQGTFRAGTDVLVANRVKSGEPGFWVVSPFDTATGTIAINRGFVSRSVISTVGLAKSAAPTGVVEFVASVQKSRRGVFATSAGASGVIEISQVDVAKLGERWTTPLVAYWAHASPAQGELLSAVEEPTLNNGSHLSYAGQWFVFSAIAVVGYPLVLRRNARARAAEIDGPEIDEPKDAVN